MNAPLGKSDFSPIGESQSSVLGRPTVYNPSLCATAIDYLAKNHSLTAFAYMIRVPPRTVRDWQQRYPEFRDAVEIGRAGRVAHLEKKLDSSKLTGPVMQAAWNTLKNVAPDEYKDKVTIESENSSDKAVNELAQAFKEVLEQSSSKLEQSRAMIAQANRPQVIEAEFSEVESAAVDFDAVDNPHTDNSHTD
jgi:hypothetical protein